jgi:hypothetical protein
MPENHLQPLIRQLAEVGNDLAQQDDNKEKEIEQLRTTCRLLASLPCDHVPRLDDPKADSSPCNYCGVSLIRKWVPEPVEEGPADNLMTAEEAMRRAGVARRHPDDGGLL